MATSKTDAETPKAGAAKKWDGNAERDLCLAMIMGNGEGDRIRTDWNTTHNIMVSLGYDFSKDAMSQRWSKTIYKDFKSRHKDETPAPLSLKKTPTKRKKAAEAAAADAANDAAPAEEAAAGAVAGSTPPATPTTAKGVRKRTPAKPKAAGFPAKPRGRKPKSAATVKPEEDEDTEQPASANKDANVKTGHMEQDQPSATKKVKAEPEEEDTEMADEA